ncbi:hypothetical protein MSG28_003465 [Choristoneura fumiferana]|uniref:Uncharacterized protein n=1 Tax=Choristoneura fumiferana TaxID=7141 RepID=A0ACC0KG00_CHOFU|nr:hypothetical protein MSG28_003465 [Choristoneura fumiferana]
MTRGPTIVRVAPGGGERGIKCCCCRCCECFNLGYLTSQHGLIKLAEAECLFNAVACFLYLSASSYMGVAVNLYLYPQYAVISMYSAYPAMTAVYYIGVVLGVLHGVDAYIAYKHLKGYR